jgi:hypothetical protein
MKIKLSTSQHPIILILMVLLMHPELKMSTIRITTGLRIVDTREGLIRLVEEGLIENLNIHSRNPTFRLIDHERAKSYLETLASKKFIH